MISCAPVIALNGLTVLTGIPPTKFSAAPPIISPAIYAIYEIDLLLVTVLLFTPTPTVVLIPLPEFITPPKRIQDICQRYIITGVLNYYSTYFVPFME